MGSCGERDGNETRRDDDDQITSKRLTTTRLPPYAARVEVYSNARTCSLRTHAQAFLLVQNASLHTSVEVACKLSPPRASQAQMCRTVGLLAQCAANGKPALLQRVGFGLLGSMMLPPISSQEDRRPERKARERCSECSVSPGSCGTTPATKRHKMVRRAED